MFGALLKELKHSLRMFSQHPAFTFAAVAALTLGIGANTAVFSVVNAVLLRPVGFPEPDRIVVFMNQNQAGATNPAASPAKFQHYVQQISVVQDVAAYNTGQRVNYTGGTFPNSCSRRACRRTFSSFLERRRLSGTRSPPPTICRTARKSSS